jgi:acetoacetate decarboxylase
MPELRGFTPPLTPTGRSSLVPPPPWHYSGDVLTIEYRTNPDRVIELLPDPLEPAEEDPGAVAVIFADWQSCRDDGQELLDPVRAQYKECFIVVGATYRGEPASRCVFIWVDTDLAMLRGWIQGYPKKLGSIHMTRPVTVGRAGPRLEAGGVLAATCAANDRRLIEATLTLTGTTDSMGSVNAHPMHHTRRFPSIDLGAPPSIDELITMRTWGGERSVVWEGEPTLRLFDSPVEEFDRLEPVEMLTGTYASVGFTFGEGQVLEDHAHH